jgi:hypothetical protein
MRDYKMVEPKLKTVADTAAETVGVTDPADLDSLRLRQDFAETCGVRKLLTTVPVRKPGNQDFIRVHPDITYRDSFPAIELKNEQRELYIVAGNMTADLSTETVPTTLFTAINRQGIVFFWPVRLPGSDGKTNPWWRSAREAAELAMVKWVRVKANMQLGAYEIFSAESVMQEPTWPELPYIELLRIAFRDRIISSPTIR